MAAGLVSHYGCGNKMLFDTLEKSRDLRAAAMSCLGAVVQVHDKSGVAPTITWRYKSNFMSWPYILWFPFRIMAGKGGIVINNRTDQLANYR